MTNIKWFFVELRDIYANRDSYFSKKRIESGAAFAFCLIISACFVWIRRNSMTTAEFVWILSIWLFIAGYTVKEIQKEKQNDNEK